ESHRAGARDDERIVRQDTDVQAAQRGAAQRQGRREVSAGARETDMKTLYARILPALALVLTLAPARNSLALSPAPDLPPGTFHELHVTSITALTVAQQITQPAVCTNPNVCLQNEIRLGMSINFDTGVIAIDGRSVEDENGNPLVPGQPGGMLFDTQSGPAERAFGGRCINPDGCPVGEALYVGTIDEGGNVSFDSIGLNFQLFGVSPTSKFRGPMGTGSSSDPADTTVIAKGVPINFA